jgi:dGTPase
MPKLNSKRKFSKEQYNLIETETSDPFLNDKIKILESKSFRRLQGKAQVYCRDLNFINPNIRDRAIHTNEVMALSAKIAKQLNLNVHLTEAIAAGHDIGHIPFGHLGEEVFSKYSNKEFKHNIFSVIVSQKIERKGKGLNLTYETLNGILNHSRGSAKITIDSKETKESTVVMIADKIAYTLADINDAIRMGDFKELPKQAILLGKNQREREYNLIKALIKESKRKKRISFEESKEAKIFKELRNFMYNNFYLNQNRKEEKEILKKVIDFTKELFPKMNPLLVVTMMTDYEVQIINKELEKGRKKELKIKIKKQIEIERKRKQGKIISDSQTGIESRLGFCEAIPYLEKLKINMYNPELNEEDFQYK